MTIVSPSSLPLRMFEKKEGARKKFRQDPNGKHCQPPILGQRKTDKRHRRDSHQKEDQARDDLSGGLESLKQEYRSLKIILVAMKFTRLLLQISKKTFRGKLCLSSEQIVKRRQPFRMIREVAFAI